MTNLEAQAHRYLAPEVCVTPVEGGWVVFSGYQFERRAQLTEVLTDAELLDFLRQQYERSKAEAEAPKPDPLAEIDFEI